MKKLNWTYALALLPLAGCVEFEGMSGAEGTLANVPEGVVAIAAPGQDLSGVRVNPDDGCYEYRHVGPVETTFLPLRTAKGNPICTGKVEG